MAFDLFRAFDWIESSHKSDVFSPKRAILLYACATCSELTYSISLTGTIKKMNENRLQITLFTQISP